MTIDKKVEILEKIVVILVDVVAGIDTRSQYASRACELGPLLKELDADAAEAQR